VRQAGAGWGLATIYRFEPSAEVQAALLKALDFMNQHSRLSADGSRYVAYPGDDSGQTGTVALVSLSHLDYLRSAAVSATHRDKYRPFLEGYLSFLVGARRSDGLWHSSYDIQTGVPRGSPSPYFDGEALLALVRAVKYLERNGLKPLILASAEAGYQKNVVEARALDPDSPVTKGYYQWSSMAFYELATSGWKGTEKFGDYVIELADWMIDVHRTLERTRNTAYAYEGIVHAYQLAKLKNDQVHKEKFARVIDQGLGKLTSWQVGSPLANQYIRATPTEDVRAIGGIQNHQRESTLRIDVAQHQMHAVILALEYYAADSRPED
jgi:UDP-N-acetylmuramoyl-tripeptide--D-alanyl-D-alanine ligase